MNVITLKPHRYKNEQKKPGDAYNFKGRAERRLAIALGWVKRTYDDNVVYESVDSPAPVVAEQSPTVENVVEEEIIPDEELGESYQFIDDETVDGVEVAIPEETSNVVVDVTYKQKRTYKRRDMVSDK